MKSSAQTSATSKLFSQVFATYALGIMCLWTPAQADDGKHPLHHTAAESTLKAHRSSNAAAGVAASTRDSIDAAASILATQAMQTREPGIGAAVPTAAQSYGALTAAEAANAQRAASALARGAKDNTQSRPTAVVNTQAASAAASVPSDSPKITVNTSTTAASVPKIGTSGSGLVINVALPESALSAASAGNLQHITINVSFSEDGPTDPNRTIRSNPQ